MKVKVFAMSSSYLATKEKVISQKWFDEDLFTLCEVQFNIKSKCISFYVTVN